MSSTPSHPPGALAQHLHPHSLTFLQVVGIEAPSCMFERESSGADENIVAWLVPELVSARGACTLVFPVPLQLKALSIQQDKSTWQTERGCMEKVPRSTPKPAIASWSYSRLKYLWRCQMDLPR